VEGKRCGKGIPMGGDAGKGISMRELKTNKYDGIVSAYDGFFYIKLTKDLMRGNLI